MSGVIVKRTPTIVVGGVQQYFKSYALRVLDTNGDEASTVWPVTTGAVGRCGVEYPAKFAGGFYA